MDTEQRFHDLEVRYSVLAQEFEAVNAERDSLKVKVASLTRVQDDFRGKIVQYEKDLEDKDAELKQRERASRAMDQSLEESNEQYRRRSEECDRLRDEVKALTEQITSQQQQLRDSLTAFSELQSKELPVQYELMKVKHEKEVLSSRVSWLEDELKSKSTSEMDLRRDFSNTISDMQTEINMSKSEASSFKDQVQMLQDRSSQQDEKIQQLLTQLSTSELSAASRREEDLSELDRQRKRADIYKRHLDEATGRLTELEGLRVEDKETFAKKISQLKESTQKKLESTEDLLVEQDAQIKRLNQLIESKDAELSVLKAQDLRPSSSYFHTIVDEPTDSRPVPVASAPAADSVFLPGFSDFNLTEMYDRVVSAEKALAQEKDKRETAELYLKTIEKSIEEKTPLILAQKRDYNRIVQSHENLQVKLNTMVHEICQLQFRLTDADKRVSATESEADTLKLLNKDLSLQVQHLLKLDMEKSGFKPPKDIGRQQSDSSAAGDVISSFLVTFDDVSELQSRNEQLLKVVRKLSEEQERIERDGSSGKGKDGSDSAEKEALEEAIKEISSLREAREKMEEFVNGLVQQRDLYRAMIEEADQSTGRLMITDSSVESPFRVGNAGTSVVVREPSATPERLSGLASQLTRSEEECRHLRDRISRLEEIEKSISEALEKSRTESASLRLAAAQSSVEARFQTERSASLEQALRIVQQTSESTNVRRTEAESLLVTQQKEHRSLENRLAEVSEELRRANESMRQSTLDLELSRASEARLVEQIANLREENRRQISLGDQILRIESSLGSRAMEEKAELVRERDSLAKSLEAARRETVDCTIVHEQKLRTLEEELRAVRQRELTSREDASSAKEELIRQQGISNAAQERGNVLERQLIMAQERLSSIQGIQVVDSVLAEEAAQKEIKYERALAEAESLKLQLKAAEEHSDQFKLISRANESALKELKERYSAAKATNEVELLAAKDEAEKAVKSMNEYRQEYLSLLQEIEQVKESGVSAIRAHTEQISAIQRELDESKVGLNAAKHQTESLAADVERYQRIAREANANYERELQLHAMAAKELREVEAELSSSKREAEEARMRVAEVSANAVVRERTHGEAKTRLEQGLKEMGQQMAELRNTNDILHSQVQSFAAQVEKQERSLLRALGDSATTTVTPASVSSVSADSSADAPIDSDAEKEQNRADDEDSELVQLRRRTRDLLEALRSHKATERRLEVILLDKTTLLEEYQGKYNANLRTLDEVRAELKRVLDSRPLAALPETQHAQLMVEVTQLNILRESSAHLRSENEQLAEEVKALRQQLQKASEQTKPLEAKIRTMEAESSALRVELESRTADYQVTYNRLRQLVSRYNDVDPEEHRLLQVKADEFKAKADEFQVKAAELEGRVTSLGSELASEKLSCEKLRSLMRTMKEKVGQMGQEKENVRQEVAALKEENRVLSEKLSKANDQVAAQSEKIEKLTVDAAASASTVNASQPIPVPAPASLSVAPIPAAAAQFTSAAGTGTGTGAGVVLPPPSAVNPALLNRQQALARRQQAPSSQPTAANTTPLPPSNAGTDVIAAPSVGATASTAATANAAGAGEPSDDASQKKLEDMKQKLMAKRGLSVMKSAPAPSSALVAGGEGLLPASITTTTATESSMEVAPAAVDVEEPPAKRRVRAEEQSSSSTDIAAPPSKPEVSQLPSEEMETTAGAFAQSENAKEECRYYKLGSCMRGSSCFFKHTDVSAPSLPAPVPVPVPVPVSAVVSAVSAQSAAPVANEPLRAVPAAAATGTIPLSSTTATTESTGSNSAGPQTESVATARESSKPQLAPLCATWKRIGACRNGSSCSFRHSDESPTTELETAPPASAPAPVSIAQESESLATALVSVPSPAPSQVEGSIVSAEPVSIDSEVNTADSSMHVASEVPVQQEQQKQPPPEQSPFNFGANASTLAFGTSTTSTTSSFSFSASPGPTLFSFGPGQSLFRSSVSTISSETVSAAVEGENSATAAVKTSGPFGSILSKPITQEEGPAAAGTTDSEPVTTATPLKQAQTSGPFGGSLIAASNLSTTPNPSADVPASEETKKRLARLARFRTGGVTPVNPGISVAEIGTSTPAPADSSIIGSGGGALGRKRSNEALNSGSSEGADLSNSPFLAEAVGSAEISEQQNEKKVKDLEDGELE